MYLYALTFICLSIFSEYVDAETPKLTTSPDYIVARSKLGIQCDIGVDISNKRVDFYLNTSFLLGSVTYDDSGCSSTSPVTYSCHPGSNITKFSYTPNSTPFSAVEFRCQYRDDRGTSHYSDNLVVKKAYIPSSAILSPPHTSYIITKGDTLDTITCSADSWPPSKFNWTGPNFTKSGANLEITNVDKSYAGTYFCQASNVVGNAKSSDVEIKVHYGPTNIKITPSTSSYTKILGQSLGPISCSADCNPTCAYQWTSPDNERHTSPLSISKLQKTHDGTFTCQANNSISQNTVSVYVTVNYSPQNVKLSTPGTSLVINEDNTLSIDCSSECKPICDFKWYDSTYRVISNSAQLRLSNIKRDQAKQYRCRARNDVDEKYSVFLNVIVLTLPSTIENINARCTGQTTATIAWVRDLTVVPSDNFTLHYMQMTDGTQEKMKIYSGLNTQQKKILLMNADDLIPETRYKFFIKSQNTRGFKKSQPVYCTTLASSTTDDSPINSLMVIGIVMITISVLLFSASIILFCLMRYRRLDSDSDGPNCPNCFLWCLAKLQSLPPKRRKESEYENVKGLGIENNSYESGKISKDGHYEDMLKRQSYHSKPYDELCVTGNAEAPQQSASDTDKELTHYISLKKANAQDQTPEVALKPNKKEKKETPAVALKVDEKGRKIPEVALKPNKKEKKTPEVALKPNKKERKIPEVALKPNKKERKIPEVALKPNKKEKGFPGGALTPNKKDNGFPQSALKPTNKGENTPDIQPKPFKYL